MKQELFDFRDESRPSVWHHRLQMPAACSRSSVRAPVHMTADMSVMTDVYVLLIIHCGMILRVGSAVLLYSYTTLHKQEFTSLLTATIAAISATALPAGCSRHFQ